MSILVTGASGRVGGALAGQLAGRAELRLTGRQRGKVPLDFLDPSTFDGALAGCEAMFLMRPPQIASGKAFEPFLDAGLRHRVHRVVVLSVKGAENNPLLPHHGLEQQVMERPFRWTMLRPADFMQNLETVHLEDIQSRSASAVPAGSGRSAFVDVEDVAAAAAKALLEDGHDGCGYTLTGPEALSFHDVAAIMSEELGRPVAYMPRSVPRFVAEQVASGTPLGMALIMSVLYSVQRFGGAAEITQDVERLCGRPAGTLRGYIRRQAALWQRQSVAS